MNVGWCLYQIFARSGTRMTESRSDAYGYNDRTELTNAVKNATLNEYAYQYDDIGNRISSICRRDVVIGHFITKRRFHFNVLDVVIDLILLS